MKFYTASRDVTYLFTDSDEICSAYVKLNSKHILFVRIFRFLLTYNLGIAINHTFPLTIKRWKTPLCYKVIYLPTVAEVH